MHLHETTLQKPSESSVIGKGSDATCCICLESVSTPTTNQTKHTRCACCSKAFHTACLDEWVAKICTLGTVWEAGADTYVRPCARPGKGKWASPKYDSNGAVVHIGVC